MTEDQKPDNDDSPTSNPYAFDEKGRPWVDGEIEDRGRAADVFLLVIALILIGLVAGGGFVYVQWARSVAPDAVWTTPKSAR